jgi:hypothetical protein
LIVKVQSTQVVVPPFPHAVGDWTAHTLPTAQHPLHNVALHTQVPVVVLPHVSPLPHGEHVAPPVPHEVADWLAYGSHVPVGPPRQHPFGHELESHTHEPEPLHSLPEAQALQAAPAAPHDVFDWLP